MMEQEEYEREQAQHEKREMLPGYAEELFPMKTLSITYLDLVKHMLFRCTMCINEALHMVYRHKIRIGKNSSKNS